MTTLDRLLGETFRRARWAENGGQPVCPWCFDGADLGKGYKPLRTHPAIRVYYCACCKKEFSDLYKSALEGIKTPLRLWACGVLGVSTGAIGGNGKALGWRRRKLVKLWRRLTGTDLAARWKAELEAAGLTAERLMKRTQWRLRA